MIPLHARIVRRIASRVATSRAARQRKAQVTVFIIIGIIILVGVALFLYIRSQRQAGPAPGELPSVEPVPVELEPLKQYVEGCMKNVGEDALMLVGSRAGHIYLDNYDINGARVDPNNADLLKYGDDQYLPYWYYQNRAGFDVLSIPKTKATQQGEDSLEMEFGDFVRSELPICLNDFAPFKEQNMDIKAQGAIVPYVRINDDDVTILVEYPLEVDKDGRKLNAKSFLVTMPVRLGRMMKLASGITKREANDVFLERATKKFISIYSGVDTNLLPPTAGALEFDDCSARKIWVATSVEQDFKEMLSANIPYIRFGNTSYDRIMITAQQVPDAADRELSQAIYDNLIIPVDTGGANTKEMRADILFDSAQMPLSLDLGSSGVLQPSSKDINLVFAQICMFDYKFYYNVKYPVLIQLTDPQSFVDNKPYVFMFPLQVVLKDNFPRVNYGSLVEQGAQGAQAQPAPTEEEVPDYDCLDESRDSGTILFNITNHRDNTSVAGASIFFQCGPTTVPSYDAQSQQDIAVPFAQKCMVGSTDNDGILNAKLPSCQGAGLVTVKKNDYLESVRFVGSVLPGKNESYNFSLAPVVSLPIKVEKYYAKPPVAGMSLSTDASGVVRACGTHLAPGGAQEFCDDSPGIVLNSAGDVVHCGLDSTAHDIAQYEQALISIEKLDVENGLYDAVPYLSYGGTQESGQEVEPRISIAPGTYTIDIQLLRSERYPGELTIAKESESKRINVAWPGKDKIVKYPSPDDVLLPQVFTGGAHITWEVPDSVYDASGVVLYVFAEDPARIIEEIGAPLDHINACSELNSATMRPTLEIEGSGGGS